MIRRFLAWFDDYQGALAEIAELRDSVLRAQHSARLHAANAHKQKCHAEAWETSARKLREDLLGAEAMLHLSEERCEQLAHHNRELARKLHPSSGDS